MAGNRIELISIGDEILLGQTLDTNSNWIAIMLAGQGMRLRWQSVVGDNPSDMRHALKRAMDRADVVLMTGGLGPTHDDITRVVLSDFFGDELLLREDLLFTIKQSFEHRGIKMPPGHELLAEFPANAIPIPNEYGTAPGIHYISNSTNLYAMPGVPVEMRGMMEITILPSLLADQQWYFKSRVLRTIGKGESFLSDLIGDAADYAPVTIAYLPSIDHGVIVRLSNEGEFAADVDKGLDGAEERVYAKISDFVYSRDDRSIEEVLLQELKDRKLKLAIAESCTGGLLCDRFVSIPGSSDVFKQGFITYSDEAKVNQLGVSADLIAEFGAVSKEVAAEMVKGAISKTNSDIALSVTGIAGPGGERPGKPVGLVYIGIAFRDKTEVKRYIFKGDRAANRRRSVQAALNLLWMTLRRELLTG